MQGNIIVSPACLPHQRARVNIATPIFFLRDNHVMSARIQPPYYSLTVFRCTCVRTQRDLLASNSFKRFDMHDTPPALLAAFRGLERTDGDSIVFDLPQRKKYTLPDIYQRAFEEYNERKKTMSSPRALGHHYHCRAVRVAQLRKVGKKYAIWRHSRAWNERSVIIDSRSLIAIELKLVSLLGFALTTSDVSTFMSLLELAFSKDSELRGLHVGHPALNTVVGDAKFTCLLCDTARTFPYSAMTMHLKAPPHCVYYASHYHFFQISK
ncbi:hypothetical protein M422DRAFT_258569 [Sphaerobolus stellatus SS14]|uniref:Unplaced genomic scaffold SPHSTscaffold_83, whole genome shotgun sequence n=1 Tax=Sphaerobolus stellatus (strain SS14) TaxID=990650 RepID=A0A0C9UV23_SPHS4|nr:hypothetical protein M422DRAFT_258569 [Sphaerobolus stellatus SS14]